MRPRLATILGLSLAACGTNEQPPRGASLKWIASPEGSMTQRVGSSIERCWRSPNGFDCLRVVELETGGRGLLYHAVRYSARQLARDEWEYSDQRPATGYVCQISSELGLATEAFSPGRVGENENNVSLRGQEPIGRPLTPETVNATLRTTTGPSTQHFDCVELGGILLGKGLGAVATSEISRAQLMQ